MKLSTIVQVVRISARPTEVYAALANSKKHSAFTGDRARIGKVGEKMSAFSGALSGTMLALQPGKRVVQTWKSDSWPKRCPESIVDIRLERAGKGTKLTLVQSAVPASRAKDLKKGWKTHYWRALNAYFKKAR
jgi:activator of HSP90 ATPase